ncbi:MAG TPA: sigma-70 family RNA polymerase sigma factor [Candidatus Saccharimonadales bacterium]|nr:sigma-70 family RNA polymerase sigma factor [Candidatus Saccharimonadales bacterium]
MRTLSSDVPSPTPLGDTVASVNVVALASQKDHQAFELLYEQHKKPLVRYLLRQVNDREAAYDLCQDAFTNAWKYVSQQGRISQQLAAHFAPWLYRVAKNLAIDYIRHNRRYEFLPLPDGEPDVVELSVPGHEELVCELLCTKEVLIEMSPQYRTCVLLNAEGLTQREIAAALGISEKTVSANISRGYVQLRLYRARQEGWRGLNDTTSSIHVHIILILQETIVAVLARSSGPVNTL